MIFLQDLFINTISQTVQSDLYVSPFGFVKMLNRNEKFFGRYGWGPLEMAEGRGPLGNRHPAPRLLRPWVSPPVSFRFPFLGLKVS